MTDDPAALPRIGLLVPPAHGRVPEEATVLYGDRARFVGQGLALEAITPDGFDAVIDSVTEKAKALADAGAQAIALMGTSISFYRGAAFTDDLASALREATGLPATTMSHAVVRGLRATGLQRLAVATAYRDDLNARLASFLQAAGFEVLAIKGLGMTDVIGVGATPPATLIDLGKAVFAEAGSADGVLISCGGLKTLAVVEPLEAVTGAPVVSSPLAALWDVVQLLDIDPAANGCGRLFRTAAPDAGPSVRTASGRVG